MATQTCIRCGGTWPISFFYVHRKGKKRAACIGCDRKSTAPNYLLIRKAHNSTVRHAKAFGLSKAEFVDRFGWHHLRMADDLKHALLGKCPYCLQQTDDPKALSFDVIDPAKPPHYSSNVRICCATCNFTKHNSTPEAWAERLDTWAKYREWIDNLKSNPVLNLPLFKYL